ncbi:hypothetical protein NU219Hw_g8627t1 [Hortaea werneckii]
MSLRRPPAAETAERNRAALKALVKLESNKSCADCKRNKHPRWASWNLGVFICIRCSGIHRSMGVHISRVKSVDLDSWTEEQLSSMIKWGNKRANRYWESKLAEGHVPNESKIENFIRTKYDSRRWVMDGPMPDPSTLDAGEDDDVPLKVVQERARATSGANQRNASASSAGGLPQPPRAKPQEVDLFGDMNEPAPARPSTTEPATSRAPPPPKAPAAAPKQTKPGESLLGLDFFGGTQSAPPARPSSTGPNTGGAPGRSDLKQSILSLYASKPTPPPQQPAASNVNAFGGMQSPPVSSPSQSNAQALGGLGDAFGSLSFSSAPQQQAKPEPFSGLTSPTGHSRAPSMNKSSLSGGSFFDMKPTPPPKNTPPPPQPTSSARKESFGADFGDFSSAMPSPAPPSAKSPPPPPSSGMGDLFDLASPTSSAPPPKPAPAPTPAAAKSPPPIQASNYAQNSAFNLSQPPPSSPPKPAPAPQASAMSGFGSLNNMDPWGSNNAWASPDPEPAPTQPPVPTQTSPSSTFKPAATPAATTKVESPFDSGWGDPEPVAPAQPTTTTTTSGADGWNVQQDEEFGGWSHASPVATTTGPKQGGLGGNADDLFGNVWQ